MTGSIFNSQLCCQSPGGGWSKITQSVARTQPLPVGPSSLPHYGASSVHTWDTEAKARTGLHPPSQAAGLSDSGMGIKAGIWRIREQSWVLWAQGWTVREKDQPLMLTQASVLLR